MLQLKHSASVLNESITNNTKTSSLFNRVQLRKQIYYCKFTYFILTANAVNMNLIDETCVDVRIE